MDGLLATEWKVLEHMHDLLEKSLPFLVEEGIYDTFTYVIPCCYLETHLKDVVAQQPVSPVRGVANILLAELRRRFAFLVDPAQGEKKFLYAAATPMAKRVIEGSLLTHTKDETVRHLKNESDEVSENAE